MTSAADVGSLLGANASVAVHLVRGYWKAWTAKTPTAIPEGSGIVTHDGIRPVGMCRIDGDIRTVSAACPHLGGVLAWNDAERSWDCPLHGSRFTATGTRLEGPAVSDLTRLR